MTRITGRESPVVDDAFIKARKSEISPVFKQVEAVGGFDPIPVNLEGGRVLEAFDETVERSGVKPGGPIKAARQAVERFMANPSGKSYMQARSDLWALSDAAWRKNPGKAKAIGDLIEGVDDIAQGNLPADVAEAYARGRRNWRGVKALERRQAAFAADGTLNIPTAKKAVKSVYGSPERGTREGDALNDMIDWLTVTENVPSSGTTQRAKVLMGEYAPAIQKAYGEPLDQIAAGAVRSIAPEVEPPDVIGLLSEK